MSVREVFLRTMAAIERDADALRAERLGMSPVSWADRVEALVLADAQRALLRGRPR